MGTEFGVAIALSRTWEESEDQMHRVVACSGLANGDDGESAASSHS